MSAFANGPAQNIRCSNKECPNHVEVDSDDSEPKFSITLHVGHNRETDEELCEIAGENYTCLECGEDAEEISEEIV